MKFHQDQQEYFNNSNKTLQFWQSSSMLLQLRQYFGHTTQTCVLTIEIRTFEQDIPRSYCNIM